MATRRAPCRRASPPAYAAARSEVVEPSTPTRIAVGPSVPSSKAPSWPEVTYEVWIRQRRRVFFECHVETAAGRFVESVRGCHRGARPGQAEANDEVPDTGDDHRDRPAAARARP